LKSRSLHPIWLLLLELALWRTNAAELRVVPGPYRSGKAYLSATFDGAKLSCVLDTGSAMTLLPNIKPFSEAPKKGELKFTSASGIPKEVDRIQIHKAELDQAEFREFEPGRFRTGEHLEPSIGMDLLFRQSFSLRFSRTPALQLDPKIPAGLLSGMEMDSHHLITLPLTLGPVEARALFDTGATITAVDRAFIKNHPQDFASTKEHMDGTDGAGHSMTVRTYRAKKIQLGGRSFSNIQVVAVDLTPLREKVDPDIQAVIGFNLIRRGDWFFAPAEKRWSLR
jgi:hypothetical protein